MEEKAQHVCSCYDLIHRFLLFKVFYISCANCQPCADTDFLLFLKDLKHLSMSSSWTPKYLRKVSQISLFSKWILILLHLCLQTPGSAFPVAHGPCGPSRCRPGQHLQWRSGIRSSVHSSQLGGGVESLHLKIQCPART